MIGRRARKGRALAHHARPGAAAPAADVVHLAARAIGPRHAVSHLTLSPQAPHFLLGFLLQQRSFTAPAPAAASVPSEVIAARFTPAQGRSVHSLSLLALSSNHVRLFVLPSNHFRLLVLSSNHVRSYALELRLNLRHRLKHGRELRSRNCVGRRRVDVSPDPRSRTPPRWVR